MPYCTAVCVKCESHRLNEHRKLDNLRYGIGFQRYPKRPWRDDFEVWDEFRENPWCPISGVRHEIQRGNKHHSLNPLTHPVPDQVTPSFVIFDIRTLWRSGLSVRVPGCQKLQMTRSTVICNFWHQDTLTLRVERQSARMSKITNDSVCHRMLYSCTHMTTVGIRGLKDFHTSQHRRVTTRSFCW